MLVTRMETMDMILRDKAPALSWQELDSVLHSVESERAWGMMVEMTISTEMSLRSDEMAIIDSVLGHCKIGLFFCLAIYILSFLISKFKRTVLKVGACLWGEKKHESRLSTF